MILNSVTCRTNLAFDHPFDQLLLWFIYICDVDSALVTASENLAGCAVDSTTCTTDGGPIK